MLSPVPPLAEDTSTVLFSPRDSDAALRFYAALARRAKQGVFLTAAFGLSAVLAEGLLHAPAGSLEQLRGPLARLPPHGTPTYLLLENEGREQSAHFVRAVRALPHGHVACGSHLPLDGLLSDSHEAEALTELNKHVEYVHTKFLLVDPLSAAPVVVSGSANFSMASTRNNDENMLVLRGEAARRVAQLYLVEFMRVFAHFAPRDALLAKAERESGVSLRHGTQALSEDELQRVRQAMHAARGAREPASDGRWVHAHFAEGSSKCVERQLFMGTCPTVSASDCVEEGTAVRTERSVNRQAAVTVAAASEDGGGTVAKEQPRGRVSKGSGAPEAAEDRPAAHDAEIESVRDEASESAHTKPLRRQYLCSRCGQPKKGHVCSMASPTVG